VADINLLISAIFISLRPYLSLVFRVTIHRVTNAEFEVVFREHKDAVYRFAWRMTGSPAAAEDVAQDVFLSLLRQPDRFDFTRGPVRPFLLGVARNLSLKRWRGESRWSELEEQQFVAEPVAIENVDVAEIVGKAVQTLPPLQREVLVLAEYEELSLEEIARVVQSEVGTIKSRLHRARENLRQMLAPLKPRNVMRMTNDGTAR
jgi:RNA polymerase sigma-70 factor (ECF subfamily)